MKLSIITISLNEKNNIKKTIDSVINQSFTDYEYIIIDGGSTDGTLEIINNYKDKITKIISESDKGIFDAQNKGVLNSSGEYVLFLNSGDYLVNDKILERANTGKFSAEIIYGDTLILHKGRLIRKPALKEITNFFMYIDTIPHQNVFIKRTLFEKAGLHDIKYKIAGDYEFFLRAFFKHAASSEYMGYPIAVNNLMGVSANSQNKTIMYDERADAQDRWFDKEVIRKYRRFRFLLYLFYKLPVYSMNILASIIFRKYLKIEE